MALDMNLLVKLDAELTRADDLGVAALPVTIHERIRLVDGTGAGAANRLWSDRRILAASASEDLDLAGVLTEHLGGTFTAARIKLVYVKAAGGNTNSVRVTRPAANGVPLFLAAGDGLDVKPGGAFLWVAPDATGVAVTASTGDLLTLANSGAGTSVTYDVVIIGASS